MKSRMGFVSNSSSSSFVVALPKDLEMTAEAIKEHVYGDTKYVVAYGDVLTVQEAANIIYDMIQGQTPNDADAISGAYDGHLPNLPDMNTYVSQKDGKNQCDWTAYAAAADTVRRAHADKFMSKYSSDHDIYVFSFSDNDGTVGCTMEHGNTFDQVPHDRISHH